MNKWNVWMARGLRQGKGMVVLSAFCLAICAQQGFSLGLRIPNQDAEAIARGNAFAATANNPSALYYNPAGITQLRGHNIEAGVLNYFGIDSSYVQSSGSAKVHTEHEMQPVPQFYYTYSPEKLPLSFGLGVYAPYGLGLKWPDDVSFRTISQEGRLLFVSVNPVVAWKVLPELSIAAGPMINYSKIKLRQGIAFPGDEFLFRGDDMDLGFNAGLLYQPHEKWSFGINYRSASTMNYTGSAKTSPSPPFPPNPTRSSAEVKYPQTVGFGISFRPTPQWNFEIDIDWTDWERLDTVNFKNTPFGDVPLQLNWKSSFFYEAGATYYLPRNYFVSFGYFYSQNSTRDLNYNPTVPDTDLHTASIGVGNRGQHWRWALAGQLITGPYNVVSGSTPNATTGQSADGKYQFFIPAATLSVGYHF